MSAPDISVVIPCRNEAGTLGACLDALEWQDVPPDRYEVLLVDGKSTDGCAEIAHGRGVRILQDPGLGPSAARNVGIREARGELVAFTDADCVPERHWLSALGEVFDEKPWIAGVGGALRLPRRTLLGRLEDNDASRFYRGVITSNVAYRRDALLAVGGFHEALACAEDYDLAWRLMDAGFDVVHDRRPVVTHNPPEIGGSVARYLGKQFWYARHDVPAHAAALLRGRDSPEARGSRQAASGLLSAAKPAGLVVAAAAGAIAGEAWLAGAALAGAGVKATRRVLAAGAGIEALPMAAVATAKELVRGAGTLVGLADLARRDVRARIKAPAWARVEPGAPQAAAARATAS